jgi:hypothetical protein
MDKQINELIFAKVSQEIQRKDSLFNKLSWDSWLSTGKTKQNFVLFPFHVQTLTQINLNVKLKL